MKKLLSITLAVFIAMVVVLLGVSNLIASAAYTDGLFTYTISGSKATITDAKPSARYIPRSVGANGYKVTSIGDGAFSGCTGLESISIPDSVTSIGDSAFAGCTSLESITIPYSVTSIGDGIFAGCSALESITVSVANSRYYCTGNHLIEKDTKTLVGVCNTNIIPADGSITRIGNGAFYNYDNLTSITIPDSVTSIGDSAFCNCSGLTSITIPDSVTSIGEWAFSNCKGLTSITIPDSVTSIGDGAFSGCTGLTSITIPDSVTSIGVEAFYGCSGIKTVNFNATNCITMGSSVRPVFKGCSNLITVNIGDNVTCIPEYAFSYCTSLESISIPDSVTSIGGSAFYYCTGLESITFPNIIMSIGEDAFCNTVWYNNQPDGLVYAGKVVYKYKGTPTETVVIKGDTLRINDKAFYNCSSLTSIVIPNSVTSIGDSAFWNCTGLTNITIPDSVTSIGDYAFSGCTGLESITIGNSVTSISDYAFSGCTGLESITIGSSVTSIGRYAFKYCTGLTSITIPNSVKSIGEGAFELCLNLESITLPFIGSSRDVNDSYDAVFGYIFGYVSSSKNYVSGTINQYTYYGPAELLGQQYIRYYHYYIPSNLKSVTISDATQIPKKAFFDCDNLENITIPDSVTSIGEGAFYDCYNLESVNITDVAAWCGINFEGCYDNPLYYAKKLYLNNQLVTDLVIPDGITNLGDYAFYDCYNLTSITIPDSVTSIGYSAFFNCSSLTSITIPDSVTSIVENAFYNTAWYNNQPNGLVYAGKVAYKYKGTCPSSVIIKSGTVGIADDAFYGCRNLEKIAIPNSVTSIGDSAFYNCNSLEKVYYTGNEYDQEEINIIGDYNDDLVEATWYYNICDSSSHVYDGCTDTTCNNCEWKRSASSHNYADATCTAPKKCKTCGATTGSALGHNYDSGKVTTSATCTKTGVKIYTCEVCKATKTETIAKLGHTYTNLCDKTCNRCNATRTVGAHEYYAATCTSPKTCMYCGKTSGKALGHNYSSEFTTDIYATCYYKGEKSRHCTRCYARTDITETEGHCYVYVGGTALKPTCTKSATNTLCCILCGYTKKEVLKATGHKYTNDCDKTCNTCGVTRTIKHKYTNSCDTTCNVCKSTRTVTHKYKTTSLKVATLKANGKQTQKCSVCKKTTTKTIYKPTSFKLSATSYTYNGKVKKPSVVIKDSAGKTISSKYYTVTFASGRKNVGKYKVTIKFKGNYSGTKTLYFTINPTKTTLSKVTPATKKLTVTYAKKTTEVSGYEIQYSTSKSFTTKTTKTKIVSKNSTTKATITGLKAKTTYYVRVRTYKTVGKTKYYSGWTTVKSAKTK